MACCSCCCPLWLSRCCDCCLSGVVVVLGILGLVFGSIFYNTIRVHGILEVPVDAATVTDPGSDNGSAGACLIFGVLAVPLNFLTARCLYFASSEPMRNSDQPEEERPNLPVPVPVPVSRNQSWPVIIMPLALPVTPSRIHWKAASGQRDGQGDSLPESAEVTES